ncbi:helix-turn-helix transcriptional regulator [Clostridioides difficile]|nr:helix-turn-helix transcriptional regulator [Clostridioides difficile]
MELDYKAIGQRIKIARIKKRLTQEVLSEKINVSPQHVSNVETGNSTASLQILVAIANVLDVSMDELLCDTILNSRAIFEDELAEVLKDCNDYEIRFITDIVKASKKSMRDIKLFQSNLDNKHKKRV